MRRLGLLPTALLVVWQAAAIELAALPEGYLFEAEAYDAHLRGDDFGQPLDEPLASGGAGLMGMWREGLVGYRLIAPVAGDYTLWMRYAAPGDVDLHWGVETLDPAALSITQVRKTNDKLDAPGAYQWAKLGLLSLLEGQETLFVLGQGALRPDCFLLATDPAFVPTPDFLDQLAARRELPVGQLLPELTHDRVILTHPTWTKSAWRACYAHFEWDPENTAESWARKAKEAGATVLVGAGEMPAGSLNGKLKPFGYRVLKPDFQFPEGYDLSYGWLKEYVDAAHHEGVKFVVYGGSFRTLDPLLVEHPEWRQMDVNGRPYPNGFGSWCSPYRQAYLDRWVQAAKLAHFDGIMIDMLFTGPTNGDYSEWTVNAFRDRFGVEPPREPNPRNLTWQRWLDFQTWVREEMALDLTLALHEVDPEIAVTINQTVGWIFGRYDNNFLSSRAANCVDGLLEEMGWEYRHRITGERPWAWQLMPAWQNLFLRCRLGDRWPAMWHVDMNYPATFTEEQCYAMLANGCSPNFVVGGNWDTMAKVWAHTKPLEPWCTDAKLTPYLALHFGEDTLNWYAAAHSEERKLAWLKNLWGWFQMCLELHLPVAIITDDDLADSAKLAPFKVVVLPNSAALSEQQASALRSYVEGGGGLVASYQTGCYDVNGTARETPLLADLLGGLSGEPVGKSTWGMPVDEGDHPVLDHPDIRGAGVCSQGRSARRSSGTLYAGPADRLIGAVPVKGVAAETTVIPLGGGGATKQGRFATLLLRSVGQGKVAFFPLDVGHAYYVYNHPLGRRLMGRSCTWAAGEPPLRTDAPLSCETVLYQQDEARVVHLLNDTSSFGRAAAPNPEAYGAFKDEVLPLYAVTVAVPGEFTRAQWLPDGATLKVTQADGWSTVTVPKVEIHGAAVFQP